MWLAFVLGKRVEKLPLDLMESRVCLCTNETLDIDQQSQNETGTRPFNKITLQHPTKDNLYFSQLGIFRVVIG